MNIEIINYFKHESTDLSEFIFIKRDYLLINN